MTHRGGNNEGFTHPSGDLSMSPRGAASLDVSLFTTDNCLYHYIVKSSEEQDPQGNIVVGLAFTHSNDLHLFRKGSLFWL